MLPVSGRPFPLEITKPKGPLGGLMSSNKIVPSGKACVTRPIGWAILATTTSSSLRPLWISIWGLSGLKKNRLNSLICFKNYLYYSLFFDFLWLSLFSFSYFCTWVPSHMVFGLLPVLLSVLFFSLNSEQRRLYVAEPVGAPSGKQVEL